MDNLNAMKQLMPMFRSSIPDMTMTVYYVVAEKIIRHRKALGGISQVTFQIDLSSLSQEKVIHAIDLLGKHIAPALREIEAGAAK